MEVGFPLCSNKMFLNKSDSVSFEKAPCFLLRYQIIQIVN